MNAQPTTLEEQLSAIGGEQILASMAVVDTLLRELVGSAMQRRGAYFEGKTTQEEAMAADRAACEEVGALLLGKGPRAKEFFLQPWNAPDQMGAYLVGAYGMSCTPEEAPAVVLLGLLGDCYEAIDFMHEAGLPEDGNAWRIEGPIEVTTLALLGVPYDFGDDDEAE